MRAPVWAPPLLAVQFLTRIPVPPLARLTAAQADDGLARAMAWLPPVGTLIGCVTATVYVAAAHVWPPTITALLALAVEALLTGAFHEDAVADFCDAFGGTARGDDALRIMRDSRIGTYGTVGLGLSLAVRCACIIALPVGVGAAAMVAAATMGRLWAVLLAAILPATGAGVAARFGGGLPTRRVLLALLLTLPGIVQLALMVPGAVAASVAMGGLFLWWIARFLRDRIGGSTGDCLGFAAYMGQLTTLLLAVALA